MGLYWKHYEACFPQSMWMHQKCLLGSLWKCHSNFRSKIDWYYRRVAYHRCTNFGSQKWFCEKRNMVCFLISLPSAKIGWEKEVIGHFRLPLYFENQFSIFDAQILVIVPFYRLSIESHDQLGFNWRRKNNGKSSFSWKQTERAKSLLNALRNVMLLLPSPCIGSTRTRPEILYGPTKYNAGPFTFRLYFPAGLAWKPL